MDKPEQKIELFGENHKTAHNQVYGSSHSLPFDTSAAPLDFGVGLLALNSIKGLGRKGITAIIDKYGEDLSWFNQSPAIEVFAKLFALKILPEKTIQNIVENRSQLFESGKQEFNILKNQNVHILKNSELPESIRQLPDSPRWLFIEGSPKSLYKKPVVAVVGTRNPTQNGLEAAAAVVKVIAAYDITIVSGLAEGIDENAHYASLMENVTNVAFLGHGINQIFPKTTADLRKLIVEKGGAVVTEYLPDEHYRKEYFVQRNRLQAALAQVVIPVQANPKGGTAHTIRFAKALKRKIIGIRWKDANGILDQLEKDNFPIADITTTRGKLFLDSIMRELVQAAGGKPFSLSRANNFLKNEANVRNFTKEDVDRLYETLLEIANKLEGSKEQPEEPQIIKEAA